MIWWYEVWLSIQLQTSVPRWTRFSLSGLCDDETVHLILYQTFQYRTEFISWLLVLWSIDVHLLMSRPLRVSFGEPSVWSWSMTSVSVAARSKRRTATSANTAASRSACQWACPTTVSPAAEQVWAKLQALWRTHTHANTHTCTHALGRVTCKHTLFDTVP